MEKTSAQVEIRTGEASKGFLQQIINEINADKNRRFAIIIDASDPDPSVLDNHKSVQEFLLPLKEISASLFVSFVVEDTNRAFLMNTQLQILNIKGSTVSSMEEAEKQINVFKSMEG